MNKKIIYSLSFILLIVIGLAAGYFVFYKKNNVHNSVVKIPSGAISVIHTNILFDVLNEYKEIKMFKGFNKVSGMHFFINELERFKSSKYFNKIQNNEIFLSFHVTGKNETDILFCYPNVTDNEEFNFYFKPYLENKFKNNKWTKRKFKDSFIYELRNKDTLLFSYSVLNGNLYFCKNGLLIDQIISNQTLDAPLPKLNEGLLVKENLLSYLNSLFINDLTILFSNVLNNHAYFQLSYSKNSIFLKSLFKTSSNKLINSQTVDLIKLIKFIPEKTTCLIQTPAYVKLILFENSHIKNYFIVSSSVFTNSRKDTLFVLSDYLKSTINNVTKLNDDFYLTSNEKLDDFLFELKSGKTWKNSLELNKLVDNSIKDASISLFVNFNNIQHTSNLFQKDKIQYVFENQLLFNDFHSFVFQVSYTNENTLIETAFNFNEKNINQSEYKVDTFNLFNNQQNIIFINKEINSQQIYLIDDNSNVVEINNKGKIQKKAKLNLYNKPTNIHSIVTKEFSKTKFVIESDSFLYFLNDKWDILDSANRVKATDFFSVFYYDKLKSVRYFESDTLGNIVLKDKYLNELPKWNPLKLNSKLLQYPIHGVVGNKDFILLFSRDNKIHLLKRNGTYYNNYPINIKNKIVGKPFLRVRKNFEESSITFLNDSNEIKVVNLNGKIISEKKLNDELSQDFLSISTVETTNKFLYYVLNKNNILEIINSENEVIFSTYINSNEIKVQQFFSTVLNTDLFSIYNKKTHFFTLYDISGNLIVEKKSNDLPILSDEKNTLKILLTDNEIVKQINVSKEN